MPSATTPLARAGKAAEGEPRVRRPAARLHTEPLAEGGFVYKSLTALAAALVVVALAALPASGGDGFPVTLRSSAGKVTIRKQPRRIVSLSPTATETLFRSEEHTSELQSH